jgi:hypothetical protein
LLLLMIIVLLSLWGGNRFRQLEYRYYLRVL